MQMELDGAITAALVKAAAEDDDDELNSSGDEDGDADPPASRGALHAPPTPVGACSFCHDHCSWCYPCLRVQAVFLVKLTWCHLGCFRHLQPSETQPAVLRLP